MAAYGFKNNKFSTDGLDAYKQLNVLKYKQPKSVAYIKLQSCAVGTATSRYRFGYLYLGTNGTLQFSSTAPTGTTGAFSNIGGRIGTVA